MYVGVLYQGEADAIRGWLLVFIHLLIYFMHPNTKQISLNYILCYTFIWFTQIDYNNTDNKRVIWELSRTGHQT